MKKVILAPDSFKGTMSSARICSLIEEQILKHFPCAQIIKIPVADGGEGTVDCFNEAIGGIKVYVNVKGPYMEEVEAFYGILPDWNTAIIEMAAAAGLPLVEDRKNPSMTSTYGVGQLIAHAVQSGCRNIIIGLGGSCTNDGGAEMAAALGIKFLRNNGEEFVPVGGNLPEISKIDISGRLKELEYCTITAMCDVNNPLYGENGAAAVFGPQKGADEAMVSSLDKKLKHLSDLLKSQYQIDVALIPGSGAAGGMGAGVVAFLGAKIKQGIDTVLDTVKFEKLLQGTDVIFTGEGKIDGQSLNGKVVQGIARRSQNWGIPVIAVVGDIGDGMEDIYHQGVAAVVSINRVAVPFEKARLRCEKDLALTMDTIMRLMEFRFNKDA